MDHAVESVQVSGKVFVVLCGCEDELRETLDGMWWVGGEVRLKGREDGIECC